jgi:hypothetical protein
VDPANLLDLLHPADLLDLVALEGWADHSLSLLDR